MRASIYAGLLVIVPLSGLGACGSTGSDHSDSGVAGAVTAGGGAGGSNHSGGASGNAGNAGSDRGGSDPGGTEPGGSSHGGSSSGGAGAGGAGDSGGVGGAGLVCESPRCIKLCQGGDCMCFCEGTGGSGGMAGAGGSSCASLNVARAQSLDTARSCNPEVDSACAKVVTVPNQCGCATLVNSAQPAAIQAAQQAYDAWIQAGCGPYACGANCVKGTAAACQASGTAPGICGWSP